MAAGFKAATCIAADSFCSAAIDTVRKIEEQAKVVDRTQSMYLLVISNKVVIAYKSCAVCILRFHAGEGE